VDDVQDRYELLPAEHHPADKLDWSMTVIDSWCTGHEGRPKISPSPIDRARTDSIHHVITEGAGIPLAYA
jgi:hypothetical protein